MNEEILICDNNTIRLATEDEMLQMESDRIAFETAEAKRIIDEAAKSEAKAALLERLGITADEAKLLLS